MQDVVFKNVVVLMGGSSSEREISLKSGKAISAALRTSGLVVKDIELSSEDVKEIEALIQSAQPDIVFIALHGRFGEDGGIQALLDDLNVPYTGSDVQASRAAFDKIVTQKILKEHHLPVAPFMVVEGGKQESPQITKEMLMKAGLNFPLMIKPAREGSSFGINKILNEKEINKAIDFAQRYSDDILIEKFVEGREITVGILNQEALPIVEIKPTNTYFDFESKYSKGKTTYQCPAQLNADVTIALQKTALEAFQALGLRHYGRVDLILDQHLQPYILEINTIPGFTETSLLPMAAQAQGMSFTYLCHEILSLAYAKKKEKESGIH